MIRLFLSLIFLSTSFTIYSQELYMPRDIKQAFANNTRSMDGKPGKNYWQNKGRYNITVTAMPPDRNIVGTEQITYINNSPDTLRNLVIKLIVNIHKPGALRYQNAGADYLTSGVHIDSFVVNGTPQRWMDNPYLNTWQVQRLNTPLLPKDSLRLSINWHYEVSLQSNREGMIDSTTYFLAYFYPRVAVYDDYAGWDRIDFTDQQEFYNDFNDYILNVKVPKNYLVWATGTLQKPETVLQQKYLDRYNASLTADSVIRIAAPDDLKTKQVTVQQPVNTWTWTADHITDVTFGLSDHFVWDASSVIVDDVDKRRASVQAAYNDTAADFHHAVEVGQHSLNWFSHKWPGIAYPYPKTTIFHGYADMEYPMMVNDGTQEDLAFAKFVAEHEIAHTYFPFYMGINESRYAFMDEGWATTLELLIGREDMPVETADKFYQRFRVDGWIHDRSQDEDLPIITPADVLRGAAYGNNAYGKPSLGYLAMMDILGDDLFKKCLHEYMARWNGKHPIPWDFFNSFNNTAGRNLNWFWNNWFFTNNYIDVAIQKPVKTTNGYSVVIKNIGGYAIPLDLLISYTDGSTDTLHKSPTIWSSNLKQATINIATKKKVQSIQTRDTIYMDADESNNKWTATP